MPKTYPMRAFSDSSRGVRGRLLRLPSLLLLPLLLQSCGGGDGGSAAPAATVASPTPGIAVLAGALGGPGNLDGTGTAARFNRPLSVAIDSSGNLYVADTNNDTIRKITSAGAVTTFAGAPGKAGALDGTGSAARFDSPVGVAVDAGGTVYVTEPQSGTVRKISPAGVVTTLAGLAGAHASVDGNGSNARFESPVGIAVDASGNVFVTDDSANNVRAITPAGDVTTLAGNAGSSGAYLDGAGSSARFNGPEGIAVDASGNLFVADSVNQVIRQVTVAGGVVTTVAGVPGITGSNDTDTAHSHFSSPIGIAVDTGGTLFVTEQGNDTIRKIAGGTVSTLAGLAGVTGTADGNGSAARFNVPAGIAVDASGQLFVADSNNATIRAVSTTADVTTFAGLAAQQAGTDGNGSAARFSTPQGIAMFADGRLAVADSGNDTIRIVTTAGDVSTFAGSAGMPGTTDGNGSAARFQGPTGVAVDASDNLYVADRLNHVIRTVAPDATVATFAGSPGVSGNTNGAGLTSARFALPAGVAVSPHGTIYVADTGNNIIRQITPGAVVSTLAGSTAGSGFMDGTGSSAYFNAPAGAAVDLSGNIFVADTKNNEIRRITPDGVVTTLAGNTQPGAVDGNGRSASFKAPQGIAVDGDGNLYVTDTGNSLLRKVTPAGDVTTVAGTAGMDGVVPGALPGSLNQPRGIVVGADGNLYVSAEDAILKITLAAPVSRFGVALTASASTITLGQSATLTWASADAASCTASGSGGWAGSKALTGSESVTPSAAGPTTYTLTCTQSGSSATKQSTVTINTVLPVPTVSLSASASHITPGQSVTLTWSSTTATSCTSTGAGWSGSQATNGSVVLTPPAGLQTYTLSCTGGGGTASATTSVAVAFPPAVTLGASALSIPLGGSTTLTWSSTDTTSCTAAGAWSGNKSTGGSQVVTPTAAGSQTYTLSCGGLNGYDSKSVVVSVQAPAAASSGGGAFDTSLLLGFGLLGLARRRSSRRR